MSGVSKATRWAIVVSAVAVAGAALVLAFLLALATDNRAFLERHYGWLFAVNFALASLLGLTIALALAHLVVRLRAGKFGSKVLLKLAGIFAVVGVVPGVLIYTVSYQFVERSIESWFDVRVEGALDAGLSLGRGMLDATVRELAAKTRLAAEQLAEEREALQPLALERLRLQVGANDVALVGANGQILFTAAGTIALAPERPPAALLRQARARGVASQLEGLDEDSQTQAVNNARVRAIARIPAAGISIGGDERYLMAMQRLDPALAGNALAVQAAYRDYQQRALARAGLRRMYIGTLTLALILSVFGALLLAATLGHQLARPLLLLAQGVRQVARGDLSVKPVFESRDELGGLTRSFAQMTQQLAEARAMVERTVEQLEEARTHLQTILDNLTSGVIVLDRNGCIESANPGATRILKVPLEACLGLQLCAVAGLEDFGAAVEQRFASYAAQAGERDHWQESFELGSGPQASTLLVRGAALPPEERLLVIDDITDVVSAQRQIAWGEVARRLAHEIKNPLTPIQLSAERLQHKLEPKLAGGDLNVLAKSVGTIVSQVQALKQLVNEFRDYARLPAARLAPLDLNELVADVLALYGAEQEASILSAERASGLPRIMGDATQLRQVIHNLVLNALEAVADQPERRVRITTQAVHGDDGQPRAVQLAVIDNGPGFTPAMLQHAFEPYATTKSKGTGLGLAVVKKIVDEHGARIRIANRRDDATALEGAARSQGAEVSISFSRLASADDTSAGRTGQPARAH